MATLNAMASQEFYETFYLEMTDRLKKSYPGTDREFPFRERIIPTLISPYILELPESVKTQAQEIVAAFFRLRNLPEWQARLANQQPVLPDPGNTSVLMSYDFHIDLRGDLRLIEINTNASLSLIVDGLYRLPRNVVNSFSSDFLTEVIASFEREVNDSTRTHRALSVAIVDENVFEQKLLIEMAMYKELFGKAHTATICNSSDLTFANGKLFLKSDETKTFDLVYNRDTDFYFSSERTHALRDAMTAKAVTITPHPHEYRLLADKDRLLELSDESVLTALSLDASDLEVIRRTLIKTVEVNKQDPEQLWRDRKKWFFKPRRSHGGKAVYRGSSTSRGTFQNILNADYLAQEIVPPPTIKFETEDEELKYDLRFYVYRNKIQLACARLYRGQMTNSRSSGGGVAPISWK